MKKSGKRFPFHLETTMEISFDQKRDHTHKKSDLTEEIWWAGTRAFILQFRGDGIKKLYDTHRSSDALHFVLLHPFGHDGWHLNLKQVNRSVLDNDGNPTSTSNRITTREYYAFYLQCRSNANNFIFTHQDSFKSIAVLNLRNVKTKN